MSKKEQASSGVGHSPAKNITWASQVNVSENPNKNGIELRFNATPSPKLQPKLRAIGFRPSKSPFMWYAQSTHQVRQYVDALIKVIAEAPEGPALSLSPTYFPEKANIEKKEFSYVQVTLKSGQVKSFLVFEPSKPNAEVIAMEFADNTFGDQVADLIVKPRTNMREARVLFQEGKIIDIDRAEITKVSGDEKTTETEPSGKHPVVSITISNNGDDNGPFDNYAETFHSWASANDQVQKMVGQFPDAYYRIKWKDEQITGSMDLEPSDLFKGKENVFSNHLNIFYRNLTSDPEAKKIFSKEALDKARRVYNEYDLGPLTSTAVFPTKDQGNRKNESVADNTDDDLLESIKKSPAKKQQSQEFRDKRIEEFIDEKDAADEVYTDPDGLYIARYKGAGGQIKHGASGRGVLYEFYTPDEIVQKLWGLAIKYGFTTGKILEPSCGIGNIFKYLPAGCDVEAFETNHYAKRITEILYPQVKVHERPFEAMFFAGNIHLKDDEKKNIYDLVIGNPPFGSFEGKYAGMGEKKWTGARTYDEYFIYRGLHVLKQGGLLIYVVPSTFLSNQPQSPKLREAISRLGNLIDAYRLPNGIFPTTETGTDIVVFKKKMIS